jgi:hypothetical protein
MSNSNSPVRDRERKVLDAAGKPVSKGNIPLPVGGERIGKWSGSMDPPRRTFVSTASRPHEPSTDPRPDPAKVKTKEIEVTVGKTVEVDVPAATH